MSFFKREWSDAEKWGMGIGSALLVTGLVALFSLRPAAVKTDIAFLAGYDSAYALALNNQGGDIAAKRSEINARLRLLGMDDITFPAVPGKGKPVVAYANQVIGFLSARSAAERCAFQLGFAGLIETNTPGTYPSFSISETAQCAGFPTMPSLDEEEYLKSLEQNFRP